MNLLEVDELQLYFGEKYKINDTITILQPKIKDIVAYGERDYYSMIHTMTSIPSDLKSQLDDMGLDYEQVKDFELFIMLIQTLSVDKTRIIFGDVDLSALKPYRHPNNDEIILADKSTGVIIDELAYELIANYLRKLHGLKKKVEKSLNADTKRFLISEDRQRIQASKNKPYEPFLLPLVSSLKVRMGYTLDYVRNMGLYEFTSDIKRLEIIHNADALLQGCYSGSIDMKKINKAELNWMQPIKEKEQNISLN